MSKTIYLKDDETLVFESEREVESYLKFRAENDKWDTPFINELGAIGFQQFSSPEMTLAVLGASEAFTSPYIIQNGMRTDLPAIDATDDSVVDCISDLDLFLVYPQDGVKKAVPVRTTAYESIIQRAGLDCPAMTRLKPVKGKKVWPMEKKAKLLTDVYPLYSAPCKVLYRDGKVGAVHSGNYAILPADELVGALKGQLANDHPDYEFSRGFVDHGFLMLEYLINDPEYEDSVKDILNSAGCSFKKLRAGIRFSTSDVGLAAASATAFYEADGIRFSLDANIKLKHTGKASVGKFGEKCQRLAAIFKESETRLEKLGEIEIKNVPACMQEIVEKETIIPRTVAELAVMKVTAFRPGAGTALDIYLALNMAMEEYVASSSISLTKYIGLTDIVAGLMYLPFEKINAGETWK